MKVSEKKIVVLECLTLLVLILNIFIKNIFNEYTIILFLGIILLVSVMLFGFEKKLTINNKKINFLVAFYSISFLILFYAIGLFTGYVQTSYSLKIINIIRNVFPVLLLIIVSEILRYNLCRKGENLKIIFMMTMLIFTCVDIISVIHLYDTRVIADLLKLITLVGLPSLTKNIMLCSFASKYGYQPNIIYQLIMNLYVYLIPIIPDLGFYLESVLSFLIPIILLYIVKENFEEKDEVVVIENKYKLLFSKVATVICMILICIIISLCSNIFPLWIAVIGSGSMTPTIKAGDAVIIDKTIKNDLSKLEVGDVLVFKMKNDIYTHRIIKIESENGHYAISTKGDRKENVIDNWTVTDEDIIGIVKCRIPYVGYPTLLLNNLMEENRK